MKRIFINQLPGSSSSSDHVFTDGNAGLPGILILGGGDSRILDPGMFAGMVGGKVTGLAMSMRSGIDVPRFFVVIPDSGPVHSLNQHCRNSLANHVAELGAGPFAVRSSARAEDGASSSHAGQFLSLLNVEAAGVADAVLAVMLSGSAQGTQAYRQARGLEGIEQPAVIIQIMVDARVAGVAFSANPVTGRRDRVLMSATTGLADRLVSGEVNGESWELTSPSLDVIGIIRDGEQTVLDQESARAVAALCLRSAEFRGCPQDVEWAIPHGSQEPILLQSRPITTDLLPLSTPETHLLVLDNSNIVESYPGVSSPLTTSFAIGAYARVYKSFLAMVGVPSETIQVHAPTLANMLSRVDGRIYYNLGNWYRFLSLLPFFSSNRAHMEAMMGVERPLPEAAMTGMAPEADLLSKARMVWGLAQAARRLNRTRAAFLTRVNAAIPSWATQSALDGLPPSQLAKEYRRVEFLLLDRWDAPIANDFLAMMAFGISRRLMEKWCGSAGVALHGDLMVGQGGIISAEPARLIREMGTLASGIPGAAEALARGHLDEILQIPVLGQQLQAYLQKFGDRRIGELKLEQPTLSEAPAPLLSALAACLQPRAGKPVERNARNDLKTAFLGRPVRRWMAGLLVSYAMARVKDRENLRFERTRIFGHARRVFRAMGLGLSGVELLAERDDVFMLTVDELMGLVEGSGMLDNVRETVEKRKDEYRASLERREPPTRIMCRGYVADSASHFHETVEDYQVLQGPAADTSRVGIACGGGEMQGIVRVIREPASEQLQTGEILVARTTDPGWISHFAHASAVVVERGSVLSHSAIVSRELGIACVVALPGATTWLCTGDRVSVNGSTGKVEKLP